METIVIIALLLFWLAVTFCVGCLMEAVVTAIKKRSGKRCMNAATERNIALYKTDGGTDCRRIA